LGFKTDNSLANFENLRKVCTNQSDCFVHLFKGGARRAGDP